jgi:hypothetical protein
MLVSGCWIKKDKKILPNPKIEFSAVVKEI